MGTGISRTAGAGTIGCQCLKLWRPRRRRDQTKYFGANAQGRRTCKDTTLQLGDAQANNLRVGKSGVDVGLRHAQLSKGSPVALLSLRRSSGRLPHGLRRTHVA